MEPTRVAIAIVLSNDHVLVGRRVAGDLKGFDEFPGGKIEPGESPERAAVRECREETGLDITLGRQLMIQPFVYPQGDVQLHFFSAAPRWPEQRPLEPFRWIARSALSELRFPPANQSILRLLDGATADLLLAPTLGPTNGSRPSHP